MAESAGVENVKVNFTIFTVSTIRQLFIKVTVNVQNKTVILQ